MASSTTFSNWTSADRARQESSSSPRAAAPYDTQTGQHQRSIPPPSTSRSTPRALVLATQEHAIRRAVPAQQSGSGAASASTSGYAPQAQAFALQEQALRWAEPVQQSSIGPARAASGGEQPVGASSASKTLVIAGREHILEKEVTTQGWTWVIRIGPITIRITFGTSHVRIPDWEALRSATGPGELSAYCMFSWRDNEPPRGFRSLRSESVRDGQLFTIPWAKDTRASRGLDDRRVSSKPSSEVENELELVSLCTTRNGCAALLVSTYQGQPGTPPSEPHAFGPVFTGRDTPTSQSRDRNSRKSQPIRVKLDDRDLELLPGTSIDYNQVFLIDFGFPVRKIGRIHDGFVAHFKREFRDVWAAKLRARPETAGQSAGSGAAHSRQDSGVGMQARTSRIQQSDPMPDPFSMRELTHTLDSSDQALRDAALSLGVDISRLSAAERDRLTQEDVNTRTRSLFEILREQDPRKYPDTVKRFRDRLAQQQRQKREDESSSSEDDESAQCDDGSDSESDNGALAHRTAHAQRSSSSSQTQGRSQNESSRPSHRSQARAQRRDVQGQATANAQTAGAIERLVERGYTREQARQYVAAAIARRRGAE